jgi:FkbM family methyltransferase
VKFDPRDVPEPGSRPTESVLVSTSLWLRRARVTSLHLFAARWLASARRARLVREGIRFALRDLARPTPTIARLMTVIGAPEHPLWRKLASRHIHTYRLRQSGLAICLRHGTPDLYIFDEVFREHAYRLPSPVSTALSGCGAPPRVLDLGANIGLFSSYILARLGGASIVAIEPDRSNAAVLRTCASANGSVARWEVVEAAAAASDGSMPFVAGQFAGSRRAGPEAASHRRVPTVDVFPYLTDAEVVKIDIEGGEWEIIDDPRFSQCPAIVIALEYHARHCPHPDPREAAIAALRRARYEWSEAKRDDALDVGVLWGWRAG